jgi:hypothetical protein
MSVLVYLPSINRRSVEEGILYVRRGTTVHHVISQGSSFIFEGKIKTAIVTVPLISPIISFPFILLPISENVCSTVSKKRNYKNTSRN